MSFASLQNHRVQSTAENLQWGGSLSGRKSVTKRVFRTIFRPELRLSPHFRTIAYKVQRWTWNESVPCQGESLSRKGAFRTVRAYKWIAGKKWTRDVLLCTILRGFSGWPLSSFRADRPTAYRKFLRISDARELWAMTTRPCRHSCLEIKVVWRLAYPRKKHNLRTYYVVQSGGYFSTRYNLFIPACHEKGLFGRFGCISGLQAKNGRVTYVYVQSHVLFCVKNHFCIPARLKFQWVRRKR